MNRNSNQSFSVNLGGHCLTMLDNKEAWAFAFCLHASKITDMKIFNALLQEKSHHNFVEMMMHKMCGRFTCSNCGNMWSSTSSNSLIKYRYNPQMRNGEIHIVKEYGQLCKNCDSTNCQPVFDNEATGKAMYNIVKRLKKVFYKSDEGPDHEVSDRYCRY